jgi:hypothetical protein
MIERLVDEFDDFFQDQWYYVNDSISTEQFLVEFEF